MRKGFQSEGWARRSGLTLIELLVVLLLLGLFASTLLPSVTYAMTRARDRDVQEKLLGSWKLARATAMAVHSPVLWDITQTDRGVMVRLKLTDQTMSEPAPILLENWRIVDSSSTPTAGELRAVIQPNGISKSLGFQLTQDREIVRVDLPGIIDESVAR